MNERTYFLIKNIYISYFIFDVSVVYERWVETVANCYIDPTFLLTIVRCVIFKNPLSTSSAYWLGLLNRGSLRVTALSLQGSPHSGLPVYNSLNCCRHLPIFFHNVHLLRLLPLIYTGASLIDGSVKGQYTTFNPPLFLKDINLWTFSSRPSPSPSHTNLTNNAQGQQQQKYNKKWLEQQQK